MRLNILAQGIVARSFAAMVKQTKFFVGEISRKVLK